MYFESKELLNELFRGNIIQTDLDHSNLARYTVNGDNAGCLFPIFFLEQAVCARCVGTQLKLSGRGVRRRMVSDE